MKHTGIIIFIVFFGTLFSHSLHSQKARTDEEKQYLEVLINRCDKIIDDYLELEESEKRMAVRQLMVKQYWDLNKVHDGKDDYLKEVKASVISSDDFEAIKNREEKKADKKISRLHRRYIRKLGKHLTGDQVNGVKDGMTYGALHHNYNGYLEMLPQLTVDEKLTIYNMLVEAREISMNKGNSRDKLGVFRQYKGRINNYLSQERGYDLNKAGKEWQERLRQEKESD